MQLFRIQSDFKSIDEFLGEMKKLAAKEGLVAQAFNPERIVSPMHLKMALDKALARFSEKRNTAKNVEAEILLCAAATASIDEAIKRVGARKPSDVLLLVHGNPASEGLAARKLGRVKKTAKPSAPKRSAIAISFGIGRQMLNNYSLEDIIIEKIALC